MTSASLKTFLFSVTISSTGPGGYWTCHITVQDYNMSTAVERVESEVAAIFALFGFRLQTTAIKEVIPGSDTIAEASLNSIVLHLPAEIGGLYSISGDPQTRVSFYAFLQGNVHVGPREN